MSTNPRPTRFALFPQDAPLDEQGRRPAIRRYSLTRLTASPARKTRAEDGKNPHA